VARLLRGSLFCALALLLLTVSLSAQSADPQPDANGIYHTGNGIYHTGNGIGVPQCIHKAIPETTEAARKRKTSGIAVVAVVVEPDGTVGSAQIVKSVADAYKNKEDHDAALTLDAKAVEAARQYRFEPTIVKGKPVALQLKIEIAFQFT
jgi:periplasmic protein TonB